MNFTKDKGDIGLLSVMSDLAKKGYNVFLPVSEHLPIDLIVVNDLGEVARVQCKYTSPNKHNSLRVKFTSTYANSSGVKTKHIDKSFVDGYAVYCPTTDEVYYVGSSAPAFKNKVEFRLKLGEPKKKNLSCKMAEDFLEPNVMFGSVAEW